MAAPRAAACVEHKQLLRCAGGCRGRRLSAGAGGTRQQHHPAAALQGSCGADSCQCSASLQTTGCFAGCMQAACHSMSQHVTACHSMSQHVTACHSMQAPTQHQHQPLAAVPRSGCQMRLLAWASSAAVLTCAGATSSLPGSRAPAGRSKREPSSSCQLCAVVQHARGGTSTSHTCSCVLPAPPGGACQRHSASSCGGRGKGKGACRSDLAL